MRVTFQVLWIFGISVESFLLTIFNEFPIGVWRDRMWPDGWTAVTADGKRSAQFEHTLLVTLCFCLDFHFTNFSTFYSYKANITFFTYPHLNFHNCLCSCLNFSFVVSANTDI